MISQTFNIDCMEFMRGQPDKAFDLAIVDPEFGHFIKPSKKSFLHTPRMDGIRATLGINGATDPEYFVELRRVSRYQIIWGANYFFDFLGSTPGLIFWDKMIDGNTTMNWAETAWQNIRQQTRIFHHHSSQTEEAKRIHPNQKPIELYRWTLQNYAKPGWKILDTHLGSGSSRIAAWDLGFDFWGTELDADYFAAEEQRFARHQAQLALFEPEELATLNQGTLEL